MSPEQNVASFSGADEELRTTLDNLEGSRNYNGWILALITPFLGQKVVEVGSGHGTFTALLAQRTQELVAVEPSERCVALLRERFSDQAHVTVVPGELDQAADRGSFDSAVLINVLEHIEDDAKALRGLADLLKPGGRVILWVPAFQLLYSEFDRKIGHYRRYRRRALRDRLVEAGLQPVRLHYVNMPGAVLWLVGARLLRRTPTSRLPVLIVDRLVIPVVKLCERVARPPFGQSLLAVAVKPD